MSTANKAAIILFASKAWSTTFSDTAIDAALCACLGDLNGIDLLTGSDDTGVLSAGDSTLDFPSDYKSVIAIQLTDMAGKSHDPLSELAGGIKRYRYLNMSRRGRPRYFIEDSGASVFRLYEPADEPYLVTVDYWRTHPPTPDAIAYPAKFQQLLNLGTTYWEAVLRRNKEYINHWGPLYYAERGEMERRSVPA